MTKTKFDLLMNKKIKRNICSYFNPTNPLELAGKTHYVFSIRTMYKFDTTQQLFAELLNINISDSSGFNVNNVVTSTREYCGMLRVRMVVGTSIPNTYEGGGSGNDVRYNPRMTNEHQNCSFRRNLKKLGIDYEETLVIQLHNWQIGNDAAYNCIRIPITELYLAGIDILGCYIDKPCYTTPLNPCSCASPSTEYAFEIYTAVIEVDQNKLQQAINLLAAIDLSNYTQKRCETKPVPPVNNPIPITPNYGTNPTVIPKNTFLFETSWCEWIDLMYLISQPSEGQNVQVYMGGGFSETLDNGNVLVLLIIGIVDPRDIRSGGAGNPLSPDLTRTDQAQTLSFINYCNIKGINLESKLAIQYLNTQTNANSPNNFVKLVTTIITGNYDLQYLTASSSVYILPPTYCPCSLFGFTEAILSNIFIVPPENVAPTISAIIASQ